MRGISGYKIGRMESATVRFFMLILRLVVLAFHTCQLHMKLHLSMQPPDQGAI